MDEPPGEVAARPAALRDIQLRVAALSDAVALASERRIDVDIEP